MNEPANRNTKDYDRMPCTEVSIRFQDCDPFGHLNNARYLDYFINAREEHENGFYNFDFFEYGRKTGETWVVSSHQIAYLTPVKFRQKVLIQTCLLYYGAKDCLIEGVMLDARKRYPCALLWSRFAYFSLTRGKSVPHPPDLMDFMEDICLTDGHGERADFEKRLAQIKQKNAL
jgi:acyl-CoA thioesterase FadM